MTKIKAYLLFSLCLVFHPSLYAQQVSFRPVSFRIFSPAIINPAITGSKDFTTISFISGITVSNESQVLSGHARLLKRGDNVWRAPDVSRFSNFGIGGYAFHNAVDSFRNIGGAVSMSYHLFLDRDALTFVSIGLSAKGLYSKKFIFSDTQDTTGNNNIFSPDIDLGIYFYSAHFFAGVSSTNFLSNPESLDFPSGLENTLSRQYFLTTGYKIILSKKRAMLLEPSLLMNYGTSPVDKSSLHYHPALKLYYKNSYIGSYLNDPDNLAFFMHLQFPHFFVGSYVEYPWNPDIAWRNNKLTLELSVGIIMDKDKTGSRNYKYWEHLSEK